MKKKSVASPRPLGSGIMAGRHEKIRFLMKLLHFLGIRHDGYDGIRMGLWEPHVGTPSTMFLCPRETIGFPHLC